MATMRDLLERRTLGESTWYIMRVIRYHIAYLSADCINHTTDIEEAYATSDRDQAFVLAKKTKGLVLVIEPSAFRKNDL